MHKHNLGWLASALLLAVVFFACEDGSADIEDALTGNTVGTSLGELKISPQNATVARGGELQFTALLNGKTPPVAVTWKISGNTDAGTTFASDGMLKVSEDENAETLTVTASVTNSGQKSSAQSEVKVLGNAGIPIEHGLTVNPNITAVSKGGEHKFTATMSADGTTPTGTVKWMLEGGGTDETTGITLEGVLSVGGGEEAARLIVRAELEGTALYGTAVVYVGAEIPPSAPDAPGPISDGLSIDPPTVSVVRGGGQVFKAYVGGNDDVTSRVRWRVIGGIRETTIEEGLLNVAGYETAETLTVRAEASDGSNATAVVTVTGGTSDTPSKGITILPNTVSVAKNASLSFTAKDAADNTEMNNVLWSIEGMSAGTKIDADGKLKVDSKETIGSMLTVRATSVIDPTKSGTTLVTVIPPSFSGVSKDASDSAIDLIKANAGHSGPLYLTLTNGIETMSFSEDLGEDGLVLIHTGAGGDTSPASVTIDGAGRTIKLTPADGTKVGNNIKSKNFITVGSGVTLTLKNIAFKSATTGIWYSNFIVIKVETGGRLIFETGASISGFNTGVVVTGMAYYEKTGIVHIDGGKFDMTDGEIYDNIDEFRSGGVFVNNGGEFNMTGGKIYRNGTNFFVNGGGVAVKNGSTFNMAGGEIYENIGRYGGGVFVEHSTFNMTGGEIYKNTSKSEGGGGVYVCSNSTFTKTDGKIYGINDEDKTNTITVNTKGGCAMYKDSMTTVNAGKITDTTDYTF
jgi:hypothetical protein